MPDMTPAPAGELPSAGKLLRSTLIAAGVAAVLLITVILPAEYGVDPTGVGRLLGLTEMGEIKVSLAREAAAADSVEAALRQSAGGNAAPVVPGDTASSPPPAVAAASVSNSDVTQVQLSPGQGREIKLVMKKGARVTFSWTVTGGVVNYDTHADAPGIDYHGYEKGTRRQSQEGVLVAAFDGAHGWFWRNRGTAAVTVTLRTDGEYAKLKGI